MVLAVGRIAIGGKGLALRMRCIAQLHQPPPKFGEVLRLSAPAQRLPRHEGVVLALEPRAPQVSALVHVGLHVHIHLDIRPRHRRIPAAQQRLPGTPRGGEAGGLAHIGIDKRLHRGNAALAKGAGAIARQEKGNIVRRHQFLFAQGPEPAASALFDPHRRGGQRLIPGALHVKLRRLREKGLLAVLAYRTAPPGVQAHIFQGLGG